MTSSWIPTPYVEVFFVNFKSAHHSPVIVMALYAIPCQSVQHFITSPMNHFNVTQTPCRLNSSAIWLFVQELVQAKINKNIRITPHNWSFGRDNGFPSQRVSNAENITMLWHPHVMATPRSAVTSLNHNVRWHQTICVAFNLIPSAHIMPFQLISRQAVGKKMDFCPSWFCPN